MSDLFDLVNNTFPANNDVGVPLKSNITITISGLDYDEDSLKEGLFVEGPDTDQYVGPGQLDQFFPDNISQGNLDNFLETAGYQGIARGETTVSGVAGDTVITFNPTIPLAPLTNYVVNLTGVLTAGLIEIDGFVSLGFTTGTGSIEIIPDTVSTSVLSAALPESSISVTDAMKVLSTAPSDRTVQQPKDLRDITIEFNKNLDPISVANANITVKAIPVTDHPNASVKSIGDIAKVVSVDGKKLTIKI